MVGKIVKADSKMEKHVNGLTQEIKTDVKGPHFYEEIVTNSFWNPFDEDKVVFSVKYYFD